MACNSFEHELQAVCASLAVESICRMVIRATRNFFFKNQWTFANLKKTCSPRVCWLLGMHCENVLVMYSKSTCRKLNHWLYTEWKTEWYVCDNVFKALYEVNNPLMVTVFNEFVWYNSFIHTFYASYFRIWM